MNENVAVVHTLPAAPFRAAQRHHMLGSVVLPAAAALVPPWVIPLDGHAAFVALLLVGMWFLVGGLGVSVGLNRLFSHRAFEASPPLRAALAVLGSMAAQGPLLCWVALHRMHHASSDRPGDPHSPQPSAWPGMRRWRAAWQGHIGWVADHDVPKPTRYARELLADPLARKLSRAYPLCVLAGLVLPAVAAWAWMGGWEGLAFGAYWGGVLRIALGHHVIWAINSWCHLQGGRPNETGDASANVAWLALLSWGESWHNNHHAQPTQARFGRGWRQPDVGWWLIRLLATLDWACIKPAQSGNANPA